MHHYYLIRRPCFSPGGNYLIYSKGIATIIFQIEWEKIPDSLKIEYIGLSLRKHQSANNKMIQKN
jgi:hypothetical protein